MMLVSLLVKSFIKISLFFILKSLENKNTDNNKINKRHFLNTKDMTLRNLIV